MSQGVAEECLGIVFLEVHLPGRSPELGGVVVIDRLSRQAAVRFRPSWADLPDEVSAEVLSGSREVLESFFSSMGFEAAVSAVLQLSNVVRATSLLQFRSTLEAEVLADRLAALLLGMGSSGTLNSGEPPAWQ